jgi:predicted HicB family RNase H-like nuclease
MVNVNIEIPDEIHKKAKLKSVLNELTLKEFIIQSIEEKLKGKNG